MSISTSAYLMYGLNIADACDDEGDEQGDWVRVRLDLPADADLDDHFESLGLEWCLTGHPDGCPMYFVSAWQECAHRGHPSDVTKEVGAGIQVPNHAIKHLMEIGKKLGIKPKCWLASYADF